VEYDPEADGTAWRDFIASVTPDAETAGSVAHVVASLLLPQTGRRKAVLLYGPRRTGKSVLLRNVEAMLGHEATSNVPLRALGENRFAPAQLYGRAANICGDMGDGEVKADAFMRLTGGDRMWAPVKHKQQGLSFTPTCGYLFASNVPLRPDRTDAAFWDRWLVVPMQTTFEGDDARPAEAIAAELQDPAELSAFLNEMLRALRDGRGPTETKAMRDALASVRGGRELTDLPEHVGDGHASTAPVPEATPAASPAPMPEAPPVAAYAEDEGETRHESTHDGAEQLIFARAPRTHTPVCPASRSKNKKLAADSSSFVTRSGVTLAPGVEVFASVHGDPVTAYVVRVDPRGAPDGGPYVEVEVEGLPEDEAVFKVTGADVHRLECPPDE
jgi:hypothetical protein